MKRGRANNMIDFVLKHSGKQFKKNYCKKNNKHRYYVTTEIIDTNEVEYNDSVIEVDYYEYKSKYVGKNIDHALLHLILLV